MRRAVHATRRAVIDGTGRGGRARPQRATAGAARGAIGYWAFDNAVLWATFQAFGVDVPITDRLMGYLIGQIGGLLPLPGGVGGIDGGLIGTLIVYGAPAAVTAAAVLDLPRDPVLAAADRGRDRVRLPAPGDRRAGAPRPVRPRPGARGG